MNPTVLLGLDGATFRILDPLMEDGVMPFLKSFAQSGVRAELLSTPNPLTPPAWISMTTGRTPGHHGVFDFIWSEEREKDHYFTLYNFRDIRVDTIWEMVSRCGGKVCVLNFPMTSPPPNVRGVVVPGLVSWKHLRLNVHPPGVYDELKSIEGFDAKKLAWDFELEKKAELGVPEEEWEGWIRFHIDRERQWAAVVQHFLRKREYDLIAIIFDGTDKVLHMGWHLMDPQYVQEHGEKNRKIRNLCLEYFRRLDDILREILASCSDEARVFLASDHGFGPSWLVFRVNTWLHQQGWLTWRDDQDADEHHRAKIKKLTDKHFVYLDWAKTLAYAKTSSSNGIYIRVAREGRTGVRPEEYESFRKELIDRLRRVKDPETGEPIVKDILTKEEAFPGAHNEKAPDLTLIMADHSFISTKNLSPAVIRRDPVVGTHYPEGIFMAGGPGIRRHEKVDRLRITDVAAILLYSLGVPIPENVEGKVPEGVFEPDFLGRNPVRAGGAMAPKTDEPECAVVQEDQEIYKQLRALGYIE